jgi:hypothetical protein
MMRGQARLILLVSWLCCCYLRQSILQQAMRATVPHGRARHETWYLGYTLRRVHVQCKHLGHRISESRRVLVTIGRGMKYALEPMHSASPYAMRRNGVRTTLATDIITYVARILRHGSCRPYSCSDFTSYVLTAMPSVFVQHFVSLSLYPECIFLPSPVAQQRQHLDHTSQYRM